MAYRRTRTTLSPPVKILLDMNLSPLWVCVLEENGFEAVHWSTVGDPRATDRTIMAWAARLGYVVFTHDLDFGALLAATRAESPSVIQLRTQDTLPEEVSSLLISVLQKFSAELTHGALLVVDENRSRIRILPLNP